MNLIYFVKFKGTVNVITNESHSMSGISDSQRYHNSTRHFSRETTNNDILFTPDQVRSKLRVRVCFT